MTQHLYPDVQTNTRDDDLDSSPHTRVNLDLIKTLLRELQARRDTMNQIETLLSLQIDDEPQHTIDEIHATLNGVPPVPRSPTVLSEIWHMINRQYPGSRSLPKGLIADIMSLCEKHGCRFNNVPDRDRQAITGGLFS